MRVTRDYHCEVCGDTRETIRLEGTPLLRCCGENMTQLLSAPRAKLDPISGDFTGATAEFDRIHRQARAVEESKSYYGE